jgi:hypothetical protein
VFRGGVANRSAKADEPGNRGDVDDIALALLAQERKHCARHCKQAKHIATELGTDFRFLAFFDGTPLAAARSRGEGLSTV